MHSVLIRYISGAEDGGHCLVVGISDADERAMNESPDKCVVVPLGELVLAAIDSGIPVDAATMSVKIIRRRTDAETRRSVEAGVRKSIP